MNAPPATRPRSLVPVTPHTTTRPTIWHFVVHTRLTCYASFESLQFTATAVERVSQVRPCIMPQYSAVSCGGCVTCRSCVPNWLANSFHMIHTHATHRPISTPAIQNEPVLSFAPGSEERRRVTQVVTD